MPGVEVKFQLSPPLAGPPPVLLVEGDAGSGLRTPPLLECGAWPSPGGPAIVNDTRLIHPFQGTPTGLPLT